MTPYAGLPPIKGCLSGIVWHGTKFLASVLPVTDPYWILQQCFAARWMTSGGSLLHSGPHVRPVPGQGNARHATDERLNLAKEKRHLPSKRILFLRLHHNYLAFCVDVFSELPGDRNQGDHRLLTVGSEAFILLLGDPRP